MKKKILNVAVITLLCGSMLPLSSCIGSFSLTNKLLSWNRQVDNKFVNELVFFAFWILPVYEVAGAADLLVLNSIEFWSGSNPMEASAKTVEGSDGSRYLVESDADGYTITSETDGSVVRLDFRSDDRAWDITLPSGESHRLMTFVDDTHVSLPGCDSVELSGEGVAAYRKLATSTCWANAD
ncbi:MAG: DUF3332 domain-containing protein [Paramuribaculum sp.]|nr:DUF3332 domain-containing protein [Paramuribaculum sp.]